MIGEDLRLLDEERQHIVTHAKQELRQRWAPMPIPHRLLTRCWHLLPAEKWSLPQSKSNAREKKPKPKPKPIIAKMAWRGRGERVQRRKLLVDVDVSWMCLDVYFTLTTHNEQPTTHGVSTLDTARHSRHIGKPTQSTEVMTDRRVASSA